MTLSEENISDAPDLIAAARYADEAAWQDHHNTMVKVWSQVVWRAHKRKTEGSVEEIIKGQKDGPTLCFIHSVLGISTEVLDFAIELGPDYRLLSVRPSSENRNGNYPSSIEKMAEEYVEELIKSQPEGDFVFVGRSAGVVIGLHMTELLRKRSRNVLLFVALDFAPYNTGADVDHLNWRHNREVLRNWASQCLELKKNSSSNWGFMRELRKEASRRIFGRASKRLHPIIHDDMFPFFTEENVAFVDQCDAAMKQYRYQSRYNDFPVLALLSTKEPERSEFNVEGKWRKIFPPYNIKVVSIPGTTHKSIGERPFVTKVTEYVREEIAHLLSKELFYSTPRIVNASYARHKPTIPYHSPSG